MGIRDGGVEDAEEESFDVGGVGGSVGGDGREEGEGELDVDCADGVGAGVFGKGGEGIQRGEEGHFEESRIAETRGLMVGSEVEMVRRYDEKAGCMSGPRS